jgi:GMP synthase (glutamine-hydrolysing)
MSDSPYILLQSRDPGDPMRAHEVSCFEKALGAPRGGVDVADMLSAPPPPARLRAARGVLMGGSGDYSVLDPDPWIACMVAYVRDEVVPSGVPTFASCFGLQILTLALGGKMVRDPENREVGSVDLVATSAAASDPLFSAIPKRFVGQAGHTDRAESVPPGATLLASSDRCPVNAYRVDDRPVWATQFHPELERQDVRTRYLAYLAKYPPRDLPSGTPPSEAPFLATLRESPHATALLRRFAALAARS